MFALGRALWELAIARLAHAYLSPRAIAERNRLSGTTRRGLSSDAGAVDRDINIIAYVIPGVARRLPWRADCLVQALAAQRWLRTRNIGSCVCIGVDRSAGGQFGAHAWLTVGDRVVTGGDTSSFRQIFGPDTV